MLNVTAPALQATLAARCLAAMNSADFRAVHAITDYSRRVRNKAVNLPDGTRYTIAQKLDALAARIWGSQGTNGGRVRALLHHILYGGHPTSCPSASGKASATRSGRSTVSASAP